MEILGIGPMELLLILIIALMVFGPDKLPEIGAKLGQTLRSVRNATHEFSREIEQTRQAIEAPLNEIKQPLAEITQPFNDIKQPLSELTQPFEELRHPFRELGQASQELPGRVNAGLAAAAATVNQAVTGDQPASAVVSDEVAEPAPAAPADGEALAADVPAAPLISDEIPEIAPAAPADGEALAAGVPAAPLISDEIPEIAPAATVGEAPAVPEHTQAIETAPVAILAPVPSRAQLASAATGVVNPQEALRQVIARQMRPEPRGRP